MAYRDYWIEATPMKLQATGEWALAGQISRDIDGGRRVQLFSAKNTVATRELAIAGTLQLGQDIIDGKAPGRAVLF